jgi:siroheme synthase (precorrin-2 oxidase/ferrochelatase)
MPTAFPIALKLAGTKCLVVGSGGEAELRKNALEAAGAAVVVVERDFHPERLEGVWLAVLTDRDAELAARMARATHERRIFFCAVDQPDYGTYSHLAITRAGPLFAAIGTQGEVPALARRLRELLDELFVRSKLAAFAESLAELRKRTPAERRRQVLNAAVESVRLEGRLVFSEAIEDDSRGE